MGRIIYSFCWIAIIVLIMLLGYALRPAAQLVGVGIPPSGSSGGGSVTSVGLAMPADYAVSGSPITGSGTLTAAHADQIFNALAYGVNGGSGFTPTTVQTSQNTPSATLVVNSVADLKVNRWVTIGGNNSTSACGTNFLNAQWPTFTGSFTCASAPGLGSITVLSGAGTATYFYAARLVDGIGGYGPAGASKSISNGPAAISLSAQVKVCLVSGASAPAMFGTGQRNNAGSNAVPMWALYRSTSGGAGTWSLAGVSTSACAIDSNLPVAADINFPAQADAPASGNENLRTRVTAISGTTITLAGVPGTAIQSGATVEKDDGGMLQKALNDTMAQSNRGGGSTLRLPCPASTDFTANCNYVLATLVLAGGNDIGVTIEGDGGIIQSKIKYGPALMLGDNMGSSETFDMRVRHLNFAGIKYAASPPNPGQNGIFIGATNKTILERVQIANFTGYGLIGDKDALSGGVWDHVLLRDDRIVSNGYGGVLLGFSHGIDEIEFDGTDEFSNNDVAYQVNLTNDAGIFGDVYIKGGQVYITGKAGFVGNGVTGGAIRNALHLSNVTHGQIRGHWESNVLGASGNAILCDICTSIEFAVEDNIHQGSEAGTFKFTASSNNNTITSASLESDLSGAAPVTSQMDHAVDFGNQASNSILNLCVHSNSNATCQTPCIGSSCATTVPSFTTAPFLNQATSNVANNLAGIVYALTLGNPLVLANSATGTTLNKLAIVTSGNQAQIAAAGATAGIQGICVSGCGTTGIATIQTTGILPCVFSGAITAGHYAQQDGSVAGDCVDGGAVFPTTGGEVVGTIVSPTNAAAGTYSVNSLGPDVANISTSGSGTINSAAQFDVPYYSAAGTAKTLSGAAITGLQLDSTSGVPTALAGNTLAASNFANSINASGVLSGARPACADLSNAAASCSTDATNAANISSGTLPAARLGTFGVGFDFIGTPTASQIEAFNTVYTMNVPANYATPTSSCTCGTNPSETDAYTIKCNSVSQGTFSLSTTCVLTLPTNSAYTCTAGQRFEMDAPATVSGANIACTVAFTR